MQTMAPSRSSPDAEHAHSGERGRGGARASSTSRRKRETREKAVLQALMAIFEKIEGDSAEDEETTFQKLKTIVEQAVQGVERRLLDLVTELAAKQSRGRRSSRGRERHKTQPSTLHEQRTQTHDVDRSGEKTSKPRTTATKKVWVRLKLMQESHGMHKGLLEKILGCWTRWEPRVHWTLGSDLG